MLDTGISRGELRIAAYIYIISNLKDGVLYTGVTSDIIKRVYEHKQKLAEGFTSKYNLDKLVYYEVFDDIRNAIQREKNIKSWRRDWKVALIEKANPGWKDLYPGLV